MDSAMPTEYIFRVATAIAGGLRDRDLQRVIRTSQVEREAEINAIVANPSELRKILSVLFPHGIPLNDDFYSKLAELQLYIGYGESSKNLIAHLWIEAYEGLTKPDGDRLLNSLLEQGPSGFWIVIESLPIFLSKLNIGSGFATSWFVALAKKVSGNLAGGGFFRAVEVHALAFPESGLQIFENYVRGQVDDSTLHLGAILLGSLRSNPGLGSNEQAAMKDWEIRLPNDPRTTHRLIYYRSLIASFSRGVTSLKELFDALDKAASGVAEEIVEAFRILNTCSYDNRADATFTRLAFDWFRKHASSNIPAAAKHHLVNTLETLSSNRNEKMNLTQIKEANTLLVAVQPLPVDNLDAWRSLEYYMVKEWHQDDKLFIEFIGELAESNVEGLTQQFRERRLQHLSSELSMTDTSALTTRLLLSPSDKKRALGWILFEEIETATLSEEMLEKASDNQLQILILEFIGKLWMGGKTSSFLLAVEPAFGTRDVKLQEQVIELMALQAINYPGVCLEQWKKIDAPSEVLKGALKKADIYFQNFEKCRSSPANGFSFPEFQLAAERGRTEFSRKVSEGAEQRSVLRKLFKTVQIIYGDQSATLIQGHISNPTPFQEISHRMESPRLEEIDPEGMVLRRIEARAKLKNLEKDNGTQQ
jgi:hypothetical protein